MNRSFDVVVIGSGFGGSLFATILQSAGMSVGLIDKSSHPRFAIGESSTPAADFLLEELIDSYGLEELRPLIRFGSWQREHHDILCGCKRGFSYLWHGDENGFQPTPAHDHELLVAANSSRDQADTQWYRPDVDQFLASVAEQRGVHLLENTTVRSLERIQPHHWSLALEQNGQPITWETKFLIDASGSAEVVLDHLQIPDISDTLATTSHAVYSHWDQVTPVSNWLSHSGASIADYPYSIEDSVIHHLFQDGWMWQIRFENNLHSLGFVFEGFNNRSQSTADQLWSETLQSHPVLSEILQGAQLAAFPGQLFQSRRLQRLRSQAAGEDWAALPFTAGFIDPLHSTGIAQTMFGVHQLANILLENSGDQKTSALQNYSEQTLKQFRFLDDLISGCYLGLSDFRLFTAFSMLYFAAATTFEQRWKADENADTDFLLASDGDFRSIVRQSKEELNSFNSSDHLTDRAINQFCEQIKRHIEPWNTVGLFSPETPNMYSYTAAK